MIEARVLREAMALMHWNAEAVAAEFQIGARKVRRMLSGQEDVSEALVHALHDVRTVLDNHMKEE